MNINCLLFFTSLSLLLTGCGLPEQLELSREKLPAEFMDYPFLADNMQFEHHSLERFPHSSSTKIQHSINKINNHVIIRTTTEINKHVTRRNFFKIDTDGNIIDEYQFDRHFLTAESTGDEQLVEGVYLVNKEGMYYTTWPLNGDKTHKPFTPINEDLSWPDEKVDHEYAQIVEAAARVDEHAVFEPISAHENKRRVRIIFYLNSTGKWYVLYGNSLKTRYTGKSLRGYYSLFEYPNIMLSSGDERIPVANMSAPYFEKLHYSKTRYAGGGSTNSAATTEYKWDGMGYYQLRLGESVLAFKNKAALYHSDFGKATFPAKEILLTDFAFYTNPHLKYALFSANGVLYLIKEK